jgi:hypothetical protein
MQSFRQYLFCAETKAWLDTMVWSSAQPHSVDDMVNKVFGPAKAELKAVWNRTSLGLSEADYSMYQSYDTNYFVSSLCDRLSHA